MLADTAVTTCYASIFSSVMFTKSGRVTNPTICFQLVMMTSRLWHRFVGSLKNYNFKCRFFFFTALPFFCLFFSHFQEKNLLVSKICPPHLCNLPLHLDLNLHWNIAFLIDMLIKVQWAYTNTGRERTLCWNMFFLCA